MTLRGIGGGFLCVALAAKSVKYGKQASMGFSGEMSQFQCKFDLFRYIWLLLCY